MELLIAKAKWGHGVFLGFRATKAGCPSLSLPFVTFCKGSSSSTALTSSCKPSSRPVLPAATPVPAWSTMDARTPFTPSRCRNVAWDGTPRKPAAASAKKPKQQARRAAWPGWAHRPQSARWPHRGAAARRWTASSPRAARSTWMWRTTTC